MKGLISRLNNKPLTLVDYYHEVYEGKIRPVDMNWVNAQKDKYDNCPGYMQSLATRSKRIFNSYAPNKGLDSKRTFVLWKMDSICACLDKYGYGCQWKDCARCPVHVNAQKQLEEIDMEIDTPSGAKFIQAQTEGDRVVFNYKGHHIEVLISDKEVSESD